MKWRCIDCGNTVKGKGWLYMPASSPDPVDYYYCDNCVPRGCSCNMELKEGIDYDSIEAENFDNYFEPLDEKGRKYPCCEYFLVDNEFEVKQVMPVEWDQFNS